MPRASSVTITLERGLADHLLGTLGRSIQWDRVIEGRLFLQFQRAIRDADARAEDAAIAKTDSGEGVY